MGNRTKAAQACLASIQDLKLQKNPTRPLSKITQILMMWATHLTWTWRTQSEGSEFDDADITDDAQGFDRCGGGMGQLENIIDIIHY